MRESTKQSPVDRGQVTMVGRCQICGVEGETIAVLGAPAPNQFCRRCAIEYAEVPGEDEDDLAP